MSGSDYIKELKKLRNEIPITCSLHFRTARCWPNILMECRDTTWKIFSGGKNFSQVVKEIEEMVKNRSSRGDRRDLTCTAGSPCGLGQGDCDDAANLAITNPECAKFTVCGDSNCAGPMAQ